MSKGVVLANLQVGDLILVGKKGVGKKITFQCDEPMQIVAQPYTPLHNIAVEKVTK